MFSFSHLSGSLKVLNKGYYTCGDSTKKITPYMFKS